MSERRYGEEEVARILDDAVRRTREGEPATSRDLPVSRGLTLAELQEIGAEVGIAPDVMAASAAMVSASGADIQVRARSMGLPQAVGGAVHLPRTLTEDEWEIFLGRVRETFRAHGQVGGTGASRSWRNGNLQVRLEPTTEGPALRMHTAKGDTRALTGVGAGLVGMGTLTAVASLLAGDPQAAAAIGSVLMPVGVAVLAVAAVSVPPWARKRMEQMRELGAFALELAGRRAEGPDDASRDRTGPGLPRDT